MIRVFYRENGKPYAVAQWHTTKTKTHCTLTLETGETITQSLPTATMENPKKTTLALCKGALHPTLDVFPDLPYIDFLKGN